jgi:endonuclease YncB( thermonuclease family)
MRLLYAMAFVLPLSPASPPSRRVVAINDSDSLTLIDEGLVKELRLSGIHCPEKSWDRGERAKVLASGMVFGRL